MGAYNIVTSIPARCPNCHSTVTTGVQFKYGSTRQDRYGIGDVLRWGANDIGVPGRLRVVADGAADSDCPTCGYDGDWDFYVIIERDRIVRVTAADGTYDFVPAQTTYLDLEDDPLEPASR